MSLIKKASFLSSLFILFISASAQQMSYGLQAGTDLIGANGLGNKTSSQGSYSLGYSYLFSFNANAYLGFKSHKFWGVSIEPGYIRKGYASNLTSLNLHIRTDQFMHYFHVPFLADFYATDKLFFSVGPELAYLLKATANSGGADIELEPDNYNRLELSALAGVQYSLTNNIDIGLRYNHAITYTDEVAFQDAGGQTVFSTRAYNYYCQFMMRFKLRKTLKATG